MSRTAVLEGLLKGGLPLALASCALLIAACGGGSSGTGNPLPSGPPPATPTPCPAGWTGTPPACSDPNTTAQGTLVDDPSGTPLAGVKVQVDPWVQYQPTPGPTPTPMQTTTTDASGHFTISMPNGTYLLVIGDDAVHTPPPGFSTPCPDNTNATPPPCAVDTPIPGASDWRPSIHAQIALTGGGTNASPLPLPAPTLPADSYYTPPPVETNGDWRLTTLDAQYEAPCYLAYNQARTAHALPQAVSDEWLVENTRGDVWAGENNYLQHGSGGTVQFLTGGTGASQFSGNANCAEYVASNHVFIAGGQALNAQSLWYGGLYVVGSGLQPFGADEEIIDPRWPDTADPGPIPAWP